MPRAIWSGTLSFGLLNVPIQLMSGERRTDLSFRMLDSRNKKPIRYERVNADTGEEVPWKDIVKAYEYDKGSYVVLDEKDIKAAAPESHEAVEIEAFVDAESISPVYYEKPYILVPGKKAEKGYVLLREVLSRTGKVGIARVVIRTREYLAAVMPQESALVMMLLRYQQEVVDPADFKLPGEDLEAYRIAPRELEMAEQLIDSMAGEWKPDEYRDEFRERLHKVIEQRLQQQGLVSAPIEEAHLPENATTNVVDFMALLKESIDKRQRTPAKAATKDVPVKPTGSASKPAAKSAARKAPAKKAAAKKAATKSAPRKSPAKKRA
ncbi:MAG: Ku protein [Xanthomonadales bacterium]|nr:Ku protein [Xanthomonadales bacterium]